MGEGRGREQVFGSWLVLSALLGVRVKVTFNVYLMMLMGILWTLENHLVDKEPLS